MCIFDSMSMAAAPKLTGFNSRRSPVSSDHGQERLGYANFVIFLVGIAAGTASPLSSPHAPMDHEAQSGDCLIRRHRRRLRGGPRIEKGKVPGPRAPGKRSGGLKSQRQAAAISSFSTEFGQ